MSLVIQTKQNSTAFNFSQAELIEFPRELERKILACLAPKELAQAAITVNRYWHQLTLEVVKEPLYRLIRLANLLLPHQMENQCLSDLANTVVASPTTSLAQESNHAQCLNPVTINQAHTYYQSSQAQLAKSLKKLEKEDLIALEEQLQQQLIQEAKVANASEQQEELQQLANLVSTVFKLAKTFRQRQSYPLIQKNGKKLMKGLKIGLTLAESGYLLLALKFIQTELRHKSVWLANLCTSLNRMGKTNTAWKILQHIDDGRWKKVAIQQIFEGLLLKKELATVLKLAQSFTPQFKIELALLFLKNDYIQEAISYVKALLPLQSDPLDIGNFYIGEFCLKLLKRDYLTEALDIASQMTPNSFKTQTFTAIIDTFTAQKNYVKAKELALGLKDDEAKKASFLKIAQALSNASPNSVNLDANTPFYQLKECLGLKLTLIEKIQTCCSPIINCLYRLFGLLKKMIDRLSVQSTASD